MLTLNSLLTIRPLGEADLDRVFTPRSRLFGERWLERQARAEVYVAVAELNGVPVGRVGLDFIPYVNEGEAYLWSAHVESSFQSRGIGTALFLHLEQIAAGRGFRGVRLKVSQDNLRAQQLYHRLGYERCGEEIDRWNYRDGDHLIEIVEECWLMRKSLTPMSG